MSEFLQNCASWGVFATLAAYALGMLVNRKTKLALFNPLLMGSIFMIVFLRCFAIPYADYSASAAPVNWLLAPATVSLAIPLYEKWDLLEKNVGAILAAILAGVITSLGSVLVMAWVMVFVTGEQKGIRSIGKKSWVFLFLSGITTGLSWLCYYRALQDGPASVVVPIDKLSILVTIVFSWIVLKEKLTPKAAVGLVLILAGTGAMLL